MKKYLWILGLVALMGCFVIPARAEITEYNDEFSGTRFIASKSGPIGDFDALEYYKAPGDGSYGIDMVYALSVYSDNDIFTTGYLKIDGTIYTLQSSLGSTLDLKVSNQYFLTDRINRMIAKAKNIALRVGGYTETIPDDVVEEWRKVASYQFK